MRELRRLVELIYIVFTTLILTHHSFLLASFLVFVASLTPCNQVHEAILLTSPPHVRKNSKILPGAGFIKYKLLGIQASVGSLAFRTVGYFNFWRCCGTCFGVRGGFVSDRRMLPGRTKMMMGERW
jgi:hypothetical protein